MADYKPQELDKKWQAAVDRRRSAFEVDVDPSRPKFYCLEMFAYPSGPRARRPRPQLHHRRRDGAHEADARLQRAAPVRLGRVRPAGGERRDQDRHAPRDVDARQHRPHERAAAAARHQLRLGARDRDLPARLLQVQPVDLPEDVRARAGVPQALDGQLVPGRQHRAGQRAGHRRRLLALRHRSSSRATSSSGSSGSPHTPTSCSPASRR